MFFPFFDRLKFKGYINSGANHKRLQIEFPFQMQWYERVILRGMSTKYINHRNRWYEIQRIVEGVENINLEWGYIEAKQKDPKKRGVFLKFQKWDDAHDKYKKSYEKFKFYE